MAYRDGIEQDLKKALKDRDSVRLSVLRMLLSAISYKEIEKKSPLTEEECHSVVKTMIKQHVESIESFKKGQRLDLAEKEETELRILSKFVPEQLSADEVYREVEAAIEALEATNQKDVGKVMRFLMEKLASRVDGKVLSEMVRKRLSS
jgi:uncharacterized protein YqeY